MYKLFLLIFLIKNSYLYGSVDINDVCEIKPNMPGRITDMFVKEGQFVNAGEPLFKVEAMKMQSTIRAWKSGYINDLFVSLNQEIGHNQILGKISQLSPHSMDDKDQCCDLTNIEGITDSDQNLKTSNINFASFTKDKTLAENKMTKSYCNDDLLVPLKSPKQAMFMQIRSEFNIISSAHLNKYFDLIFLYFLSNKSGYLSFFQTEAEIKKGKFNNHNYWMKEEFDFGFKKLTRLLAIIKDYFLDHINNIAHTCTTFILMLYLMLKRA